MIINKMWEDFHSDIVKNLDSNNDIENFLRWKCIQITMHAGGCHVVQFETLKNNKNWNKWKIALKEDSFGNPILSNYYPKTSYASIYHAYSLSQIRPKLIFVELILTEFSHIGGSKSKEVEEMLFNMGYEFLATNGNDNLYKLKELK